MSAKKIQGAKTIVTILETKGKSTLVEYMVDEMLYRKYVPTEKVLANFVEDEVLASGINYGFPWEEMDIKFDMRRFAIEMQNAELWTAQDVLKSPQKLTGVLRKVFEEDFKAILQTAVQEQKRS